MELGNQIKAHRAALSLSQEELAEKVYVTRQTVSNWETGKSYPDIHSLLLLSALFDVSLDQLIKGDLETMKQEVNAADVRAMNRDGIIYTILLAATIILPVPLIKWFGLYGLIPELLLWGSAMYFARRLERIKKANNVQSYREILAFSEGKRLDEIEQKVNEMLALVKLTGFERRNVTRLSGGQQQRVAIARALVSRPRVLLLDEPLAALDLKLRKDMQQELKNIQKATGITFVFVTHDQEEALSMSDTIVVMSEGRIQQIGTPIDIYNEPENAFVADFIGESNIVDGIMRKDFSVTFSGHTFTCVDKGFAKNENVDVVIRPEDVDIVPIEQGMLRGTVTSITFMGVHYEIIIDINGFKWMIQTTDYVDEGAEVGLYIEPDAIHIMKKSEYSGMYGDYSSFSNELDELSDAESEPDE